MLLVIDVGNTNTVLGVFKNGELEAHWRLSTTREKTADEYGILCRNLLELGSIPFDSIDAVAISSVVPPLNDRLEEMSRQYFNVAPYLVDPSRQRLMKIRYNPIRDVGADRIVNSVAAFRRYGGPCIIVDFGTATTFDAVSRRGEYLGGVIAPGVQVSTEALVARAARLPRVEIKRTARVIGASTVESIQSGIFHGYVAMVDGILTKMAAELPRARNIATGGLARLIAEDSERIELVDEDLTLFGILYCYQDERSSKRRTKDQRQRTKDEGKRTKD
ncbi:MAG: type III pantothenate kinase [Acidobacteriota bacterium]